MMMMMMPDSQSSQIDEQEDAADFSLIHVSPTKLRHGNPGDFGAEGSYTNQPSHPVGLPLPEKKKGKCNLRKSLDWDSAFFTNAGLLLDADELSSIIEGAETSVKQKFLLPGIEVDVSKSYDSVSTLESDSLTLESLEADLFFDVRASIHRTGRSSAQGNCTGTKLLEEAETANGYSKKAVEISPRNVVSLISGNVDGVFEITSKVSEIDLRDSVSEATSKIMNGGKHVADFGSEAIEGISLVPAKKQESPKEKLHSSTYEATIAVEDLGNVMHIPDCVGDLTESSFSKVSRSNRKEHSGIENADTVSETSSKVLVPDPALEENKELLNEGKHAAYSSSEATRGVNLVVAKKEASPNVSTNLVVAKNEASPDVNMNLVVVKKEASPDVNMNFAPVTIQGAKIKAGKA